MCTNLLYVSLEILARDVFPVRTIVRRAAWRAALPYQVRHRSDRDTVNFDHCNFDCCTTFDYCKKCRWPSASSILLQNHIRWLQKLWCLQRFGGDQDIVIIEVLLYSGIFETLLQLIRCFAAQATTFLRSWKTWPWSPSARWRAPTWRSASSTPTLTRPTSSSQTDAACSRDLGAVFIDRTKLFVPTFTAPYLEKQVS
jgi:hypothetical protein